MIITGTEAIRSEAIKHFRVSPERIVTVPIAAGSEFHPGPGIAGATPYFLFVGTLEPRKNVPAAIEAWRRDSPDARCRPGNRRPTPRGWSVDPEQEPGLRALGEVPNEDLPRFTRAR